MEEVLEKVVRKAKGYDAEVSATTSCLTSLSFRKDKCTSSSEGSTTMLEIRLTKGGKSGYSFTNDLGMWDECLKRAKGICGISRKSDFYGLNEFRQPRKLKLFSKEVQEVTPEQLKEHGKQIIGSVRSRIIDLEVSKASRKKQYLNSSGMHFSEEKQDVDFEISMKHRRNVFYETQASVDRLDFLDLARKADEMCRISSRKTGPRHGIQRAILGHHAVCDLLSVFSPHFFQDNANKGKSSLSGKMGKRIFSDKVSIFDWGNMRHGNLSRTCDSEGTPSMKTNLVSKGVLRGFVSDITSGKGTSTGNCSLMSERPSVGLTNFVISGGKGKFADFISGFTGIYVLDVMGTHTANPISGDFSLSALNAFSVRKGVISPLKSFMISGNAFETFKNISDIFNEERQIGNYVCPEIVTEIGVVS